MTESTSNRTRPTLRTSTGPSFARILGIGGYRPRRVVDNAEIVTYIDSSDEWIQTRSGIKERRWASADETVKMMSIEAARKAIDRAGLEPAQIDTVIVSTVTHLHQTPSIATTIASELGATGAAAFDISAACAGFCYGTAMADTMVRGGSSKYVLVIGVERLSDMTAVIGPSDTPAIGPVVWGSDGDQADLINQSESWDQAVKGENPRWPVLQMKGNPVFKWASYTMAKAAAEAMDAAGVRPEDLEVFVPHQANMRITDAMFRALKLPSDVVIARDIAFQGNTSAASIPLAIETLLETGQAHSGQLALIIGFGAGLVYAGQVIVLP
jgi:3-oxoacyl-[acyl-carrier-protein] synthase-3